MSNGTFSTNRLYHAIDVSYMSFTQTNKKYTLQLGLGGDNLLDQCWLGIRHLGTLYDLTFVSTPYKYVVDLLLGMTVTRTPGPAVYIQSLKP